MASPERGIPRRSGVGPFPLSFSQERLWFLDQLTPGTPLYNIPVAARFEGEIDLAAFRASIAEILRRHEILRTCFPSVAGRPVQEVARELSLEIPVVDLRSMPSADREAEARRRASAESVRPFDLEHGPLLRVTLLRLEDRNTVVLLTVHHIVFDEWSLGIFMRELASIYEARSCGFAPSLAEPRLQYADYAAWQRDLLKSEGLEAQLAYWRRKLEDVPLLEVPSDFPRPALATHRGASQSIHVPAALTAALRQLGRRHGCTLFMTLLATFKVLLARYSGQTDFAIGVPIANRNHLATENLIGFFVNTLVLRTGLAGDPAFVEMLARVRETSLGAYAHQDLPFVTLVEKLQPDRALSHNPLFQVIFQLIAAPDRADSWESRLSSVQVQRQTAIFDLTLGIEDRGQTLDGAIVYTTDLFSAPAMARMAGHFVNLLESIVEKPSCRISELALMTAGERSQVLAAARPFDPLDLPATGVHDLVAEQARRDPNAHALSFGGDTLSYEELITRASRIAAHLRARGVGPEAPVAVALPRSAAMVTAWLGILRAGGAYVPIDFAWPLPRVRAVLEDTGARLLLADSDDARWNGADLADVSLVDIRHALASPHVDRTGVLASPEQLAVVMYTSGSTGAPKGIGVSHRAIHRLIASNFTTIRPGDRIAQVSSCSFDAATFEIWCALARGATVCGIAQEIVLSPEQLASCLKRERITHIFLTTALFNEVARTAPGAFEGVGEVLFGGENADVRSVEQILEFAPPARLVHVYGPTENTTFSTFYEVKTAPDASRLPIGDPLAGTEAYILGPEMELVPQGAAGELFLGGQGLARGYLNRPALTAETFVPDPYSQTPGARLYRTGDRARLLRSGAIEFLGRRDTQVKLRGYRIELEEVEAALSRHAGVREAAVVIADGGPKGRRLVAYVAPKEGQALSAAALRAFVKGTLPEYMAPAEFVFLPRLPIGATGKLDRAALPPPTPERAVAVADYNSPRNDTERALAELWRTLLDRAPIGIYDNFFELGGHSLMAAHLIARVRAQLQVEIPLRALFESPTIAGLAEQIAEARRSGAGNESPLAIAATRSVADPPASFAQCRIRFMDQLAGRTPLFNIPHAFRIAGPLRPEALEWALGQLLRRHESLRTRFLMRDGELIQAIAPYQESFTRVAIDDLESLPGPERAREVARQIEIEKSSVFDLELEIPIRCRLLREDAEHWTLLLTLHHIAFDSVSETILFRELSTLYSAYLHNLPSPLEDLPVQYAQYAIWQREWLTGAVFEREMRFWKQQLDGLAPILLPFEKREPARSHAGATAWRMLSADAGLRVRRLAQTEGSTLFMILLAGLQAMLRRLTGQSDIVVGTPVGTRPADAESLIGFFVNMVVLRGDVSGDLSFRELLARVKNATLEAFQHQDLPFEKIVETLQPDRKATGSPLFRIVLALQRNAGPGFQLEGLDVERLIVSSTAAKYDLTFLWLDAPDTLTITLEYNIGVLDTEGAERLLEAYVAMLDAASRVPDCRLRDLAVLAPAERRMLEDFGQAPPLPSGTMNLARIFEQHARSMPDAPAIIGAGELTYGELDRRANHVAVTLLRAGVHPDAVVALYLPRSPEMIVGMLGILKAGAAFLPLEPSDPLERTMRLLRDAGVETILTESKLAALLTGLQMTLLMIEGNHEASNCTVDVPPESLAYVMYTSGSTGSPKGVAVTHRGIAGLLRDASFLRLGANTCMLQASPHNFDASTLEIWGPLLNGGRVAVLLPGTPSLDDIGRALREYRVTTLWLTAALFHQMVEDRLDSLAGLRELIAGGDVVSPAHARTFLDRHPHCHLVNGYGPTEATVFASCYSVPNEFSPDRSTPIGRPVAGTAVYILDDALELVPVGVAGSLYVGGPRLARGYHRHPDWTAAGWIPDPFAATPGAHMYATGDTARWLADGNLEFLGRRDRQVKIRGYRVELAEVEALLGSHPAVRQAAALLLSDGRLAACIVLDSTSNAGADQVAEYVRSRAPSFLVPSVILAIDRLPLTPNGKVDYHALRALPVSLPRQDQSHRPPSGPLEELVAAIWCDVFDIESAKADDNFFDAGGHSLLAMRVVSRLRGALGREVPLEMLFEAPTIRELSHRLATLGDNGPAPDAIPRVSRDAVCPLSPRQEVVWQSERSLPRTPLFTIGAAVRLRGAVNREALERTFADLVARHESLRTCYFNENGRAVQQVRNGAPLPVEWIENHASDAPGFATEFLLRGFDLTTEPPWRAAVIALSPEEHVLAIAVHHIAADGWSVNVLAREFDRLYRAHSRGEDPAVPVPAIDYIDCCAFERNSTASRVSHRDYWIARLAGPMAKLGLPFDHPRPAPVLLETARARFVFGADLTARIDAFARHESVTRFTVLLALYQLLLHELTGSRVVRIGAPFANRARAEYEEIVGLFTNTVILDARFSAGESFRDALHQARATILGAEMHQSIPFREVADALVSNGADPAVLYETMFLYQNGAAQKLRASDLEVLPFRLDPEALRGSPMLSSADLILEITDQPGRIQGSMIYRPDLFDPWTIRRWVRHFRHLADDCVSRPGEPRIEARDDLG